MEAVWQDLIRAVPWGAVIIILRYLDIREKKDERAERDANAKEKSAQDRETQITINKTYADAINALAKTFENSAAKTEDAIKELKVTLVEQYENLGITQDLLEIAKTQLSKRGSKK